MIPNHILIFLFGHYQTGVVGGAARGAAGGAVKGAIGEYNIYLLLLISDVSSDLSLTFPFQHDTTTSFITQ